MKRSLMRLISFLFLSISIALASCNDTVEPDHGNGNGNGDGNGDGGGDENPTFYITATALPLDIATRAELSGESEFVWWEGDELLVFHFPEEGTEPNIVRFALDNADAGLITGKFYPPEDFEIEEDSGNHTFYAVYPADVETDYENINLYISGSQTQSGRRVNDLFLVGSAEHKGEGTPEIEMSYPFAIMDFEIDVKESMMADDQFISLRFEADVPFAGNVAYSLASGWILSADQYEVSLEYDKPFIMRDRFSGRLSLLPVDFTGTGAGFRFVIMTDGYEVTYEYNPGVVFEANRRYEIKIDLAEIEMAGNISILEVEKSANSFIMKPGEKKYVRVNRAYEVWSEYLGTNLSNDVSVELIWQDTPGLISELELVSASDRGKYSVFSVVTNEDVEGNALIGVRVDGEIRWSWHLWILEDDPTENVMTSEGYVFMDRNLGAVSATPGTLESFGLLYNWGRKDPLPHAAATHDTDEISDFYDADGNILSISSTGSPTLRYYLQTPLALSSVNTWGGSYGYYSWGYKTSKTVFDPCPEGWRVPPVEAYQTFETADWDTVNLGAYFNGSWFPANGTLSWSYIESRFRMLVVGQRGMYATATKYTTSSTDYSTYLMYFFEGAMDMGYATTRGYHGDAVRCIAA